MKTLMEASIQCATRPADESFETLHALHNYNVDKRQNARQGNFNLGELEVIPTEKNLALIIPTKEGELTAEFNNWSFTQLSNLINIPPSVTKLLPPNLASDVINYGLKNLARGSVDVDKLDSWNADDSGRVVNTNAKLLYRKNGKVVLDGVTSPNYGRFWDADASELMLTLADKFNLHPAPRAFNGYRGLYAGPKNTFMFLVDNERRIFEKDENGGLSRGIMVANSEVGAGVLWVCTFLYEYVCGNHMVWGADNVREYRFRHSKNLVERFDTRELQGELHKYIESSTESEENLIKVAMNTELGKTKEETLEKVYSLRIPVIGKKFAERIYDKAVERENWYGNPRSVWGYSNALTEIARDQVFADARMTLDQAASKILDIAA